MVCKPISAEQSKSTWGKSGEVRVRHSGGRSVLSGWGVRNSFMEEVFMEEVLFKLHSQCQQ